MGGKLDRCRSCDRLNDRTVNVESCYHCGQSWPDNTFQTARTLAGP